MSEYSKDVAIILKCEGMGDCLFAIPVIKKLTWDLEPESKFVVFTHRPNLFLNCPNVGKAYDIRDIEELSKYDNKLTLFELDKLPHHLMDTFDFISLSIFP